MMGYADSRVSGGSIGRAGGSVPKTAVVELGTVVVGPSVAAKAPRQLDVERVEGRRRRRAARRFGAWEGAELVDWGRTRRVLRAREGADRLAGGAALSQRPIATPPRPRVPAASVSNSRPGPKASP